MNKQRVRITTSLFWASCRVLALTQAYATTDQIRNYLARVTTANIKHDIVQVLCDRELVEHDKIQGFYKLS